METKYFYQFQLIFRENCELFEKKCKGANILATTAASLGKPVWQMQRELGIYKPCEFCVPFGSSHFVRVPLLVQPTHFPVAHTSRLLFPLTHSS